MDLQKKNSSSRVVALAGGVDVRDIAQRRKSEIIVVVVDIYIYIIIIIYYYSYLWQFLVCWTCRKSV